MKSAALLGACLALFVSCSTLPPATGLNGHWPNDCMPQAAAMCTALNEKGVQAKVLIITTPMWKHAVTVYLFPAGDNTLWVYDSTWKSIQVRAYFSDPWGCAKAWLKAIGTVVVINDAQFL